MRNLQRRRKNQNGDELSPQFLVPCDECGGRRYREEILKLKWNGRASPTFSTLPSKRHLRSLNSIIFFSRLSPHGRNRAWIPNSGNPPRRYRGSPKTKACRRTRHGHRQGQARYTGGQKPNLYVWRNPPIGLHPTDTRKLIHLLHRLVEENNTVVVIEHGVEIIAEETISLNSGRRAGKKAEILHRGTIPEALSNQKCRTAPFLKSIVAKPKNA